MKNKRQMRHSRHLRVRNKLTGSPERPRLNVYRSLKNIYAQIIDDVSGNTLVAASSLENGVKEGLEKTGNKDAAKKVGELIAERAVAKGIERVVFDRGGNLYHGRVKALADGAREKGLKF